MPALTLVHLVVAEVTRLEDRPKLLGLFGAVFGGRQIYAFPRA